MGVLVLNSSTAGPAVACPSMVQAVLYKAQTREMGIAHGLFQPVVQGVLDSITTEDREST